MVVHLTAPMASTSHLLLQVYNSWAGRLLHRSSISMHRSMILVHLPFCLVSFVGFIQINIFGSFLVAFLLSVIILGHKALQCAPSVLVVLLTHPLYFCLAHVEANFFQGLREPFHDVSMQLHCCRSIT